MKESDITQPVIDKCKQIAEYWRVEIYEGCWILFGTLGGVLQLIDKQWVEHLNETGYGDDYVIPVPSISDVLRKLGERREFMPEYYNKKDFDRSLLNVFKNYIGGKFTVTEVHYWLLSALLGVLRHAESWDYRLFHPCHHDDREK